MSNIVKKMGAALEAVRAAVPLVHNITNYVTVNDCANALLAIGGSPIMADDLGEAADITAISKALVLNIGTLNARTVEAMLASGRRANELGIPVVLDPVGAGASALRNETVRRLLREVRFFAVRGNLSELSFLAGLQVHTKGVDVAERDAGNDAVAVARQVAQDYSCTAAVTGVVDTISDGRRVVRIKNGSMLLGKVTGTGCMSSAMLGAFAAVEQDGVVAAAAAVLSMALAGELAEEIAGDVGLGSFHMVVLDGLSKMSAQMFEERARIDE